MRLHRLIINILLIINCGQIYAFDAVKLDQKSSLFTVFDKSVPIITTKYVAWDKNWSWAGVKIKSDNSTKKDSNSQFNYLGDVGKLNMDFSSMTKTGNDQFIWKYHWNKKIDHPEAIGFGIEFNLKLNSSTFNIPAQVPVLLPDNQGWQWQMSDGQTLDVTFKPKLAKIFFERDKKNKIRAFIFTAINSGTEESTMTVSVSGKKAKLSGPVGLEYGKVEDHKSWPKDILSDKVSPIDLSFLNKNDLPAGKRGFVKAKGDKLVFGDGTSAKFWGTNMMAYALFSTPEIDIKAHAKRLAQLGYNLVRIHHHDSDWVEPNIFQNQKNNTQELSETAFKKLDWWIQCLEEQGIYIWLDLHVGRAFTKNDGIDNFEDIAKGKSATIVKGYNYFNESIQKQMQRFNETYLNHVNSFTKLAYKNDPAVIALLITNENDLTQHYGNLLLPKKGNPIHSDLFANDVKQFAQQTGLEGKKLWRTWDMGDSKIFLADVEHRFNQKMITHLRNLGAKSPMVTTNSWGKMGLFGLPSLTDGDLIDAHSYGNGEEFNFNPHYNPGFLTWIGAAQVTGKPLSVTEWNMGGFPIADRFTSPLYVAGIANLQGWDAMMLYGYSQVSLGKSVKASNFSTFNDPAITGVMPAAALLYRLNQVSGAKNYYELKLSRDDFYSKLQDPTTSKTIRTLLETSRFSVTVPETKGLSWLKNNAQVASASSSVINDANKDFIPSGQDYVQSDNGELKRNWEKGFHTINTPEAQVASGWLGDQAIKLDNAAFNIKTKKAMVAIQSMEDKPLKSSRKIFITAMARSTPTDDKRNFLTEPVVGDITFFAPSGLTLYPINKLGERGQPIKAAVGKGKYQIELTDKNQNHWFVLTDN